MIEKPFTETPSATLSVNKDTLDQEINICRQRVGQIKGILFGGDESKTPSEKVNSLIDELIDEMKIINANLEDIYTALSSLK